MADNFETMNPEAEALEQELPDDFDIQDNEDGSATVLPKQGNEITDDDQAASDDFYNNLAEMLDTKLLEDLSTEYLEYVELDKKAREKREKQYAEALQRSGLGDDAPGGAEFQGASRVVHPMLAEAAVDFSSRAIKELFPADGAVRTKIEGKVTPKKMQKADRKRRHMSWQLRKQIKEFRANLEQILTQVPMGGVQYSKMYYCERWRRPMFEFIPLDDIYIPFHAADFYSAERVTHRQRLNKREFADRVASGMYIDPDEMGEPATDGQEDPSKPAQANDKIEGKEDPQYDQDGLRTEYEIKCWLKLDDDHHVGSEFAYAPYIMTIDNPTKKIVAIYRNWDPEVEPATYEALDWIVEWPFVPWRGAMHLGLEQLVGGLSAAATGALRALMDSAHINNAPTAIKLKGAQFSGQSTNISVTQIHEIDAAPGVDDIKKIAMPLPFNPPSTVLFELLGFLIEAGRGVVRTAMEVSTDTNPNTPVGTELSRVEQGLIVYSAIHARLHASMERTLSILHRLNKQYLEKTTQEVDPEELEKHANDIVDEVSIPLAFKDDYEGEVDVQPVSDPNIFSEHQRFAQMQSVQQLVMQAPSMYNVRAIHKRILQMLKVPDIDEIMPTPDPMPDENPATENIKMAMGQTAAVLPDQDHLAHLQVHMDFMQNPLFGKNSVIMDRIAQPMVEHLIQHSLMLYGEEIKNLIQAASGGMDITDLLGDEPEIKEALSKAVAAASPMALEATDKLLPAVMKLVNELMEYVKSITPPPPMDPSVVAQQDVQARAQQAAQKAQLDKEKNQITAQKNQTDQQLKAMEMQQEAQSDKLKAEVDLIKNREDNATALEISGMRAEQGKASNLKNGTGIDQDYAGGGLVKPSTNEDNHG